VAFGGGFGTGFADPVIEEPAPTRGGGGGLGWRWPRLEPWQPPAPPPPPRPVKVKVKVRWPWILATASVTAVTLPPVTMLGAGWHSSARVIGLTDADGQPVNLALVKWLSAIETRVRETQELSEIAMALEVWR
jgi:hypothetical protein